MNRVREVRHSAGMGIDEVASEVGADPAEIALAELGVGHVRPELALALAHVLDVHPGDLFPGTRDAFDAASDDLGGMAAAFGDPARAASLEAAGVDPDPAPWFATVDLASGARRRYLLDSVEASRLRRELTGAPARFTGFLSDCRHVLVGSAAVDRVTVARTARYARFSSRDAGWEIQVVAAGRDRAERFEAGEGGDGAVASFLRAARAGNPPPFLPLTDVDGSHVLIPSGRIEALEVPVGVIDPSVYGGGTTREPGDGAWRLEGMEAAGTA